MSVLASAAVAVGTAAALAVAGAPAALAADGHHGHHGSRHAGAVFVQTNARAENSVVAFARGADGALTRVGEFATGGRGGVERNVPLDALASQDSLTYDPVHRILLAVNAGSDTITSFAVDGTHLQRRQVLDSGGQFPVSLTARHGLVYVLNAGGVGNVTGFRVDGTGRLHRLPHASADLGLDNTAQPDFITAPADIALTPDGEHLAVTTKANNTIEVFGVHGGRLTEPVANPSAGGVPFAVAFDPAGRLVVANASSTVSTYVVRDDGTLRTVTAALDDGQAALCWIAAAGDTFFGANAGSNTISAFAVDGAGNATLTGSPDGIVAHTDAGPIDLDVTNDGTLLYVENALAGTVEGYRIGAGGTLTKVAAADGLPQFDTAGGGAAAGMEGLVAL
jgi:6-phosphogluconolactonase (cycloisomerase 2 family)